MIAAGLVLSLDFARAEEPIVQTAVEAPAVEVDPAPPLPPSDTESDSMYLLALESWRRGDAREALVLAQRAQSLGSRHDPAALLEAYAQLRLRRRPEALAILRRLAEGESPAERPEVRRAASRLLHKYVDRQDRSHPSFFLAGQLAGRYTGAAFAPGAGYSLGVDYPLTDLFGLAGEVSAYDTSVGTPVLEGPVLDVLASAHIPIGTGSWGARIKAGPALWFAGGAISGGALAPTLGTRAVLGLDVRPWPVAGFFLDGGAWAWPALAGSLPSWMFAWDVRVGMVFWIRPPSSDKR